MRGADLRPRWRWPLVVAGVAIVADGTFEAISRPFTITADAATAAALAGVLVVGTFCLRRGRHARGSRPAPSRTSRKSRLAWACLVALVVAYELIQFFTSPRSYHPTLSSMLDPAGHSTGGRAVMFAVWLAAGLWLFGPWPSTSGRAGATPAGPAGAEPPAAPGTPPAASQDDEDAEL